MHVEFEEMLLELVPGDHLNENIYKLKKLANVAGLLVSLSTQDGSTYLSIRYDEKYTEFFRTRNAGRPRKSEARAMTRGEVFCAIRQERGAKAAAAEFNMSLSTFYRRYWENMGKDKGELFS